MSGNRLRMRGHFAATAFVSAFVIALSAAAVAFAVVTQHGGVRVAVKAEMKPVGLPRTGERPISVSLGGAISTVDESPIPPLKSISIEINRHGRIDYQGLPTCALSRIQPASTDAALARCRTALVGRGGFNGAITLPGAAPYPMSGPLLIFNGRQHGHEVLYAHAFSDEPFALSFVMTFRISEIAHGTFGTALTADVAKTLGKKRSLNNIEMTLSRRYSAGGTKHSFLSAGCPAPKGFGGATFSLARTSFTFAGRRPIAVTVPRTCKVR